MRFTNSLALLSSLLLMQSAYAHGPTPVPLQNVPVPTVPGLLDGSDPIVINKDQAIALGKALFWDQNVGSDGMACGSCHFHAGADSRVKNQVNPGLKSPLASGQTYDVLGSGAGGPNHTLSVRDFPTHRYNDPLNAASGVSLTTDDVVSSAGTFSGAFNGSSKLTGGNDDCSRTVDSIFHVNGVGTRRVEPRNAPTVINAIFNYRNFWDGRANNIYNGSSPWGDRDASAGVWIKTGARSVVKQRLHLENSSLASLSMGPALSDLEMSCRQRKWPDIGRKLLLRQPLQNQKVHYEDSVLGAYSLSSAGNLKPGLNTTYQSMVMKAFNSKYWSFAGTGPFGKPTTQTAYNQMEANFSMFFGIALQLYQGTLISDQSPFDLSPRDAQLRPTWEGLGKTTTEIASLKNGVNAFFNNHCNLCHTGPTMTLATIATSANLLAPTPGKTFGPNGSIPFGPNAFGPDSAASAAGIGPNVNVITRDFVGSDSLNGTVPKLMDLGFANTGVDDPNSDPGVAGVDDFGNPLSFSAQYVQYVLDNSAGVVDSVVKNTRSCDFITGLAYNVSGVGADDPYTFYQEDGVIADGSKEGVLRNLSCLGIADAAFIPSASVAQLALNGPKLAIATQAAFKIPTLRNIELTGPYMHNGSMATLEQVVEFYGRKGNFQNDNIHNQIPVISTLAYSPTPAAAAKNRSDLVAFLKSLTDERVRYEMGPFDHPEVIVPNGHVGDDQIATSGNPLNANFAKEETLTVPAVGKYGAISPILPFHNNLVP